MEQDPRHRNELCDRTSVGTYLLDYAARLKDALATIDGSALERALELIETATARGNKIYAIGNGGSAAIADHLCCDWVKGTHVHGHPTVSAQSLSANVALYSAIANDFGFEGVFSRQLEFLGREGDVLLAISSSGNSSNIIAALNAAHNIGMSSIGLSGFGGGKLKALANINLHISANNYGLVEDAHQAVCHVIAQYIALGRDQVPTP